MRQDSVLRKRLELSALPSKDSKTRRLFILADGKRTLAQLYDLCGFDGEQGASIVEFLLGAGAVELSDDGVPDPGQGIAVTDTIIEIIAKEMAHYVGPIAIILVQKMMQPGKVIAPDTFDAILAALAEHIEAEKDRQYFLNQVNNSM